MEEILNKIKPKYECMSIDEKGSAGGIAILLTSIISHILKMNHRC